MNESVALRVIGFCPVSYFKLPAAWSDQQGTRFVTTLASKLGKQDRDDMIKVEVVRAIDMYGFRGFIEER